MATKQKDEYGVIFGECIEVKDGKLGMQFNGRGIA